MKKISLFLLTLWLGAGAALAADDSKPARALIVGGGSSHNFQRWFNLADVETLSTLGGNVDYTEKTSGMAETIASVDVLYLSNNKPFEDDASKQAVFKHVEQGKGLLLVHAALWYSWRDWPEFNKDLCGGGSRAHDRFGEFTVTTTKSDHPIMKGVPETFSITDELYYFTPDPEGPGIEILATATSTAKNQTYPMVFVVKHPKARIVGITLGHDGLAHDHPAYKTLLKNAFQWVQGK